MQIKKEQIILAVIIIAAVLYILFRNQDREIYRIPELDQVAQADVSKIEIIKPDLTIILQKKDKEWFIQPQDYLVNNYNIESILGVIEHPDLTAMVSESKNFILYGLEAGKKITVKAWSGDKQVREFDVGKVSESFGQTFIKLADDHRVYHARKNLRNDFDKTVDELREKTVLSFDQKKIKEIDIVKGTEKIQLNLQEVQTEKETDDKENKSSSFETVWVTADNKNIDKSEVDNLFSSLSNLRCQEYIYDKQKNDLTDPIYTVKLSGEKEYSLQIFKKPPEDEHNYPSISSENDSAFRLIGWQADRIMKDSDKILDLGNPVL